MEDELVKLWDKGYGLDELVEAFTVRDDPELDQRLVPYDCDASTAHAEMLGAVGLLAADEVDGLRSALAQIKADAAAGEFEIRRDQEDCHTAIEERLTGELGDVGKKIHMGRSRNDQVLTAMRLWELDALQEVRDALKAAAKAFVTFAERFGDVAVPGYTHTRPAMPSTVADWAGAFASALQDDLTLLDAATILVDQSPLGSAAGFGVPVLPVDRTQTAQSMGFSRVMEPVTYAQHSRGKFESHLAHVLSLVMYDLAKFAADAIFVSMPGSAWLVLPESYCTGSSIMPQKKNPDVLELVRGLAAEVSAESQKLLNLASGLIGGYHRDLQLTKGPTFRVFDAVNGALRIVADLVSACSVDVGAAAAAMPPEIHATTRAYELVMEGVPFRDAYRQVAQELAKDATI